LEELVWVGTMSRFAYHIILLGGVLSTIPWHISEASHLAFPLGITGMLNETMPDTGITAAKHSKDNQKKIELKIIFITDFSEDWAPPGCPLKERGAGLLDNELETLCKMRCKEKHLESITQRETTSEIKAAQDMQAALNLPESRANPMMEVIKSQGTDYDYAIVTTFLISKENSYIKSKVQDSLGHSIESARHVMNGNDKLPTNFQEPIKQLAVEIAKILHKNCQLPFERRVRHIYTADPEPSEPISQKDANIFKRYVLKNLITAKEGLVEEAMTRDSADATLKLDFNLIGKRGNVTASIKEAGRDESLTALSKLDLDKQDHKDPEYIENALDSVVKQLADQIE